MFKYLNKDGLIYFWGRVKLYVSNQLINYYTKTQTNTELAKKANTVHSHINATTTTAGYMSYTDKSKLDKMNTPLKWSMTLTSANWTLVEGMYEQRVDLTGMLEIYEPEPPILVTSSSKPTKIEQIKNMHIREIESYNGYVIYRCLDKPVVDLQIILNIK